MKASDVFKRKMSFSFEVFPKVEQPIEPLKETLKKLAAFNPDFVSCTYGAGGTNKGRNTEVCQAILEDGMLPITHFTCIGNTKEDIVKAVEEYKAIGVENMLALRGDLPKGWEGTGGDFHHADELIAFIKEIAPDMCLAAAGYPEKHIQCDTMDEDIAHLRRKQDNGAEFIMTQLCHDVDAFERFRDKARKAGVTIPIEMGIMPVLKKDPIIRMTIGTNGCSIPADLAVLIGKYGEEPEAFAEAGKEYTVKQIFRFINAGVDGIHIFTLNKYDDVADILHMAGIYEK